MASSAVGVKLDPEITSALDLIQLLETDKHRTELIKEIVRERQVIVFTCHPHLLSHFSEDTVIVLKNGAEPA